MLNVYSELISGNIQLISPLMSNYIGIFLLNETKRSYDTDPEMC